MGRKMIVDQAARRWVGEEGRLKRLRNVPRSPRLLLSQAPGARCEQLGLNAAPPRSLTCRGSALSAVAWAGPSLFSF